MKNVSRNKFMLCFRPVVDMELVLDHPNSRQQLLYLGVDQKPPLADSPAPTSITRRPQRRTLSQAVKAVVFETILAKKVREKHASTGGSRDRGSNSRGSKCNSCKGLRSSVGADKDNRAGVDQEICDSDSAPSSSSSSSSSSTQEPILEQTAEPEKGKSNEEGESKRKEEQRVRGSGLESAVYLVLVSLTLTILWGRLCAVLLTLIFLYFLPRRQVVRADEGSKRLVETKLSSSSSRMGRSCRKKVIMEGLLDRTNRRGSIQFLT